MQILVLILESKGRYLTLFLFYNFYKQLEANAKRFLYSQIAQT